MVGPNPVYVLDRPHELIVPGAAERGGIPHIVNAEMLIDRPAADVGLVQDIAIAS